MPRPTTRSAPLRRILPVAAALLCALAGAAPAAAHEGNPDFESLIRSVSPAPEGFRVEVLNGDDRLAAVNRSDETVTIHGYKDEPYVRMAPDGTVSVNLNSEAHYLNQGRFSGVPIPAAVDLDAPPRWKVVERNGRYEFHDHRIHWMAKSTPKQVTDESRRTKILDWSVPVRAGGQAGAVTGTLWWRGSGEDGAPAGAFAGLGALLALSAGLVVTVRRRRRRAAGAGEREAW